jgi:hypothetical protein
VAGDRRAAADHPAAGVSAACGHLRRYLAGERSTVRDFASQLADATRTGWRLALLWWAGLALFAFDLAVACSGALPGGPVLAGVSVLGALALIVAGLRTAAGRRPGDGRWRAAGGGRPVQKPADVSPTPVGRCCWSAGSPSSRSRPDNCHRWRRPLRAASPRPRSASNGGPASKGGTWTADADR